MAVLAYLARDADAGAAVRHAGREVVDVGGLVLSGEASLVVLAAARVVHADVLLVALRQLLDGLVDVSVQRRATEVRQGNFIYITLFIYKAD